MNYEELVKALRDIEKTMFALGTSSIKMDNVSIRLAYDKKWGRTAKEAADAIEALNRLVDLNTERCEGLREQLRKAQEQYEKHLNELEQQLPKRGEWVEENRRPRSSQFVCSECHRTAYDPQPTRDKAWRKRCRYAYCPNCGAKMEVQE